MSRKVNPFIAKIKATATASLPKPMNPKLVRAKTLAEMTLAYNHPTEVPLINVACCSGRPYMLEKLAETINSQTVTFHIVSIITQGYTEEQVEQLKSLVINGTPIIENIDKRDDLSLGARHNLAIDKIEQGIVVLMDDDDVYFPNYTKGMVNLLVGSDSVLTYKSDVAVTTLEEDGSRCTGWLKPFRFKTSSALGVGGALVFTKEVFDKVGKFADRDVGYDALFQDRIRMLGLATACSDPFNFAITRGLEDHVSANDEKDSMHFWHKKAKECNDINFEDLAL